MAVGFMGSALEEGSGRAMFGHGAVAKSQYLAMGNAASGLTQRPWRPTVPVTSSAAPIPNAHRMRIV
jgi:hypothetical protein